MEQVKKGFKKTEAGVIPEDWSCEKIEQIAKICQGSRIKGLPASAPFVCLSVAKNFSTWST